MLDKYSKWIEENVTVAHGMCSSTTMRMQKEFPELTRVRGHYGHHTHWWLTTTEGEIVDPTKSQFMSQSEEYTPWVEGSPEPVGKCMNCGDYVWTNEFSTMVCSAECCKDLEREYNTPIRRY